MREAFQSLANAFQSPDDDVTTFAPDDKKRKKKRGRHLVSGIMGRVNIAAPYVNLQLRLHGGAGMEFKFALHCINAIKRANFLWATKSTPSAEHETGDYLSQHYQFSTWLCDAAVHTDGAGPSHFNTPTPLGCPPTAVLTEIFCKLRKSKSLMKLITNAHLSFADEEQRWEDEKEAADDDGNS